ncbi:MAG TPA: hypothetical protein VMR76_01605 [Candidatus Saccharimonadia bacterium]|nr:hypothetical protein [Candidatus Saccharimonadia bacterium]
MSKDTESCVIPVDEPGELVSSIDLTISPEAWETYQRNIRRIEESRHLGDIASRQVGLIR